MNEQPIVEITVHTDYESFKAFSRDLTKRWIVRCMLGLAATLALGTLCGFLLTSDWGIIEVERSRWFWTIFSVWAAFALGYFAYVVHATIHSRSLDAYKKYKDIYKQQRHYAFYENHLYLQMPHNNQTVDYVFYAEARETKAAFYLKTKLDEHVQFPKEHLSNDQATALRELFARKFGENFKGLK